MSLRTTVFWCLSACLSFSAEGVTAWDYENISLGSGRFDITGNERANGITGNSYTVISLYDNAYAQHIYLANDLSSSGYSTNVNLYDYSSVQETTLINSFMFLSDNSSATGTKGVGEIWASGDAVVRNTVFQDKEEYNAADNEGGIILDERSRAYDSVFYLDEGALVIMGDARAENTWCDCAMGYLSLDDNGVAVNTRFTGDADIDLWLNARAEHTTVMGNADVMLSHDAQMIASRFWGTTQMSLYDDSSATDTHFYGHGDMRLYNAARADKVVLNNDSVMLLYHTASASNVTLNDASLLTVQDSAVIHDTTITGGRAMLFDGASATGNTLVEQHGELVMENGTRAGTVTLQSGTLFIQDLPQTPDNDTPAYVETLDSQDGILSFMRDSSAYGAWATLEIGTLSGTGRFIFNTDLAATVGNFVTVGGGSGQFGVVLNDTGREITDSSATLNVINDRQGDDIAFTLQNPNGQAIQAIDAGVYMYSLYRASDKDGMNGNIWYLGLYNGTTPDPDPGDPQEPGEPEVPEPGDGNEPDNGDDDRKVTTPSTDAVLNITSAVTRVLNAELDGFRAWRGALSPENLPQESVWGHYLNNISRVNTINGAGYRLRQDGVEIGADRRATFAGGSLLAGVMFSWTDNDVMNRRGGRSSLESRGVGVYARWFDDSGVYLDGIVKGNRLHSSLRARMTNGGYTHGEWHHYALSGAVEAGFRFQPEADLFIEPYLRTQAVQANAARVRLSNGMRANTGQPRSLRAEAGSRVGGKFSAGGTRIEPYVQAAILRELVKSNEVTLNGIRFDNDVQGSSFSYGAGAAISLTANTVVYGEINRREGGHIDVPRQGTLGLRMRF